MDRRTTQRTNRSLAEKRYTEEGKGQATSRGVGCMGLVQEVLGCGEAQGMFMAALGATAGPEKVGPPRGL